MKMIVNQPYSNPVQVLGTAFFFVKKVDQNLTRLSDLWRPSPDSIALYDSSSNQSIRFGHPVDLSEDPSQNYSKCLAVDDRCYEYDDNLTREEMEQVLQVLNNVYGDSFFIEPTPIGYAYYL